MQTQTRDATLRTKSGPALEGAVIRAMPVAADYLVEYPYGCVEQTSSRLIPLIAMRGLLDDARDVDAQIAATLGYLQSMQLDDGQFAYWPGSAERPDRIVLFFDELPPGTTRVSLRLVATTKGRFELPAAVAEAMYEPETLSRTTRETVVVLPRGR